jgi:N-acetylglucosamine kinase-like BadF-type ATPase
MPSLVLGVDAGNTKTLALVTDLNGRVVGSGRAGCGDIYASTPADALAELDRAIGMAGREAGTQPDAILGAGFSLAGADWPEDYAFLEASLARHVAPSAKIVIVNDALGALRAGSADGDGVAVVCGTGSAIGARRGAVTWHASFWGEDAGALAIGRAALRAMVRAELGLDPPVAFAQTVLEVGKDRDVTALLHRATRRGAPRVLLADLAPLVLEAADRGDPTALELVVAVSRTLGDYARVAAGQVGLGEGTFPLVLAGGVFRHASGLLRSGIAAALPAARPTDAGFEPVVGAVLLALDRLGRRADLGLLERTLPPSQGFRRVGLEPAPGRAEQPT